MCKMCLPAGDSPLEDFWQWIKRTGLSETSAVALLGLHSIARWWPDQGNTYSFPHATLPAPSISNQYFRYQSYLFRVTC